jgi:alpha-methylacyl-CoA racemase
VVELAGIGPGPFAAMVLADLGASVVRVARPTDRSPLGDPLLRGRPSIWVDLKDERGQELVRSMAEKANVLLEGFRPGVVERLGLGPDVLLERNPRLVFGRVTGWGQDGPWAGKAGHDIDYIALGGALGAIGRAGGAPVPPINLLGDFGGGGMLLLVGVLAALWEAERSGRGQVVDAAMVDGTALLMAMVAGLRASGQWSDERGTNLLDTGAPFYDVYRSADGGYVAVGALEPQFFAELTERLGLEVSEAERLDRARWPELRAKLAEAFSSRTRSEWEAVFEDSDACVAPVLSFEEAASHPHNVERDTFVTVDGVLQPAPAPRFSRTPAALPAPAPLGRDALFVALADFGVGQAELVGLERSGVISLGPG